MPSGRTQHRPCEFPGRPGGIPAQNLSFPARRGHRAADRAWCTPCGARPGSLRARTWSRPASPSRRRACGAGVGNRGRRARAGEGGGRRGGPRGAPGQSRGPNYLRMLCASMLRFWLLEHTTATRSGDDGMAAAAPSTASSSATPADSRGASALARWRPRRPEVTTRKRRRRRLRHTAPGPSPGVTLRLGARASLASHRLRRRD